MKYLVKNKYWDITEDYNVDKLLYLLVDRPDYIEKEYNYSCFWWLNNNQYHRDYDLPTYFGYLKMIKWVVNNKHHRENNKPAVILTNGEKEYWPNGKHIK